MLGALEQAPGWADWWTAFLSRIVRFAWVIIAVVDIICKMIEEIKTKVKDEAMKVIKKKLEGQSYTPTEVTNMSNNISTEIISELKDKFEKYKFMLSTLIMQKGDGGLSISGACLWDSKTDGNEVVMHETDHLICIVNIFFVQIN